MKEEPIALKPGDPCPVCGGEFAVVSGAAVKDGDALYRCTRCGYYTRLPEEPDTSAASATPAPARGASRSAEDAEEPAPSASLNPHGQAKAPPRRAETSRASGA